ncbi:MAG: OB-fold protein [Flavisolibacter sp.]
MKRTILIIVVLVIGLAAWYGYKLYSDKNPDLKNSDPDFTLDAAALIQAFNKDSAAASKQYINKIVLVKGTISKLDTSGVVALGTAGEMSTVECNMDKRHKEDLAAIKEGSDVSVKGRCTGFKSETMLDVNLGTTVEMNFCVIPNNK